MGTARGYKSMPIPYPCGYGTRGYPYPWVKLPSLGIAVQRPPCGLQHHVKAYLARATHAQHSYGGKAWYRITASLSYYGKKPMSTTKENEKNLWPPLPSKANVSYNNLLGNIVFPSSQNIRRLSLVKHLISLTKFIHKNMNIYNIESTH
jgi:hypothetical protein